MFDSIVIGVARNISKTGLFSLEDRLTMIRETFVDNPRVEVDTFEGLLVNYAENKGISVVLRGLRSMTDFEYEYQMANMNRSLNPGIETCFLLAEPSTFYVSSRLVKEVASLGGDIDTFVPPAVRNRLRGKFTSETVNDA
jgi:pantetheine-phosphate adenylyltransferase